MVLKEARTLSLRNDARLDAEYSYYKYCYLS